jgi:hypothetical protein
MDLLADILELSVAELEEAVEMIYDEPLSTFQRNGTQRLNRNIMMRPIVFRNNSAAMAADVSTQEGVRGMQAATLIVNAL